MRFLRLPPRTVAGTLAKSPLLVKGPRGLRLWVSRKRRTDPFQCHGPFPSAYGSVGNHFQHPRTTFPMCKQPTVQKTVGGCWLRPLGLWLRVKLTPFPDVSRDTQVNQPTNAQPPSPPCHVPPCVSTVWEGSLKHG